jgi:mono/diheme cytochrome c family protein
LNRATGRRIGAWALALLALGAAGGGFIYSGVYDISATEQHTVPVYWLLEAAMRRSVHAHASAESIPDLSSPELLAGGRRIYHAQCERCHGAPGVAPDAFALGMTPVPANLTDTARRWSAADIYWVTKHGIKATGMPAWKYRLSEQEIRETAAFVARELRFLSPDDYRNKVRESATGSPALPVATPPAAGDAKEGKRAIQQYACGTCHAIPGITGATKPVGPPLRGMASRVFIAGVLSNTEANMIAWLMSPPKIDPLTAMPELGVSEHDARNMTAYLATLTHTPARLEVAGGDPRRAASRIDYYGCGSCHTIPGVRRAEGLVGPPLSGLRERTYIAGVLVNTPDNLVRWIRFPREVDPRTAMPDMGVSEADARDIAALLYSLR